MPSGRMKWMAINTAEARMMGLTWSAPLKAKFPFNPKGAKPVMISDSKGLIHILWIDENGTLSYAEATTLEF